VIGVYHSIVGLPRSGKTTFLAAFWHLVNAGEVSTTLALSKLVGDHRHLNAIWEAWRRGDEVAHTSLAGEAIVSIHLQDIGTGRDVTLGFPDLDGESFRQQVQRRICNTAYVNGLDGPGGILLFIMADGPIDGVTLTDLSAVLEGAADHKGSSREWTPHLLPQQVQLVELLQFLQRPPFHRRRRRVAVVVSAWDAVLTPRPSPNEWLEREYPLLHQFLQTNTASFDLRVYGVSAQGCDLKSDQKEELLKGVPSERVQCIGPDGESHDLTDPVAWLTVED
jgi:hypothetical protein